MFLIVNKDFCFFENQKKAFEIGKKCKKFIENETY